MSHERFTSQLPWRTKSKVQLDYLNKHRATLSNICTLTVYLLSTQLSTILWNYTDCSCTRPFCSASLDTDSCRHSAQPYFQRPWPKKLSFAVFYSKTMPTITERGEKKKKNVKLSYVLNRAKCSLWPCWVLLPSERIPACCMCTQKRDPTSLQASKVCSVQQELLLVPAHFWNRVFCYPTPSLHWPGNMPVPIATRVWK